MKHQARKRFGQNFLTSQAIIDSIIHIIHPSENDQLVEIGPGCGALTREILKTHPLTAIELDRDLCEKLKSTYQNEPLTLIESDILAVDFTKHFGSEKKVKLFGNLPYNISTPILFHIIDHLHCFQECVFMLQKEVVDRIIAPVNAKNYGRLSIMLGLYFDSEGMLTVPKEAFDPMPKVTSMVVKMRPKHEAQQRSEVQNAKNLNAIVAMAFQMRRKTIANALAKIVTPSGLLSLDIDPALRPQNLSAQDFIKISNAYNL